MATETVFALIDCNNFFVSCEKVFNPELNGKPVVVLSNNDGNAVARSNEAKALDIKMGQPFFEFKEMFEKNGGVALSANFQLYGDMSRRITDVIRQFSPDIEVYSVDESFVDLSRLSSQSYTDLAAKIRQTILDWTGVPTSVGLGQSKTLAKAASEYAKQHPETSGSFSSIENPNRQELLKWLPVKDVWGIGFRWAPRLERSGVKTAQDFINLSPEWLRKNLSVRGLRTWEELKGISCVPLLTGVYSDDHEQKTMTTTRLFGSKIRDLEQIETSLANHAARLSAKLRRRKQIAWQLEVYMQTNQKPYRTFSQKAALPYPTSDTSLLIKESLKLARLLYDNEKSYRRVGLTLLELRPEIFEQMNFVESLSDKDSKKKKQINKSLDKLNNRFGPRTLTFGSQGVSSRQAWQSKRMFSTPAYTTKWSDIPRVKAK